MLRIEFESEVSVSKIPGCHRGTPVRAIRGLALRSLTVTIGARR